MNIKDLQKHDPNEAIGDWDDFRDLSFYKCRDGSFFPYYKRDVDSCINDFYPNSVIEILKFMNYPFFEKQWILLIKHEVEKIIKTGHPYHSILGKYISRMNLVGFKNYTFEDSVYTSKETDYYDGTILIKIRTKEDEK